MSQVEKTIASNAIQLLQRVQISGTEVQAYLEAKLMLEDIASGKRELIVPATKSSKSK